MTKIVIDTNVIASAIFFGGRPRELLEYLIERKLNAFVTEDIILEYQETVQELCSRYPTKPPRIPLGKIITACTIIEKRTSVSVCRDPDDNKFIECAIDGNCLYIVSGDKDLLTIGNYDGVQIVTVTDFLSEWFATE